MPIVQISRIQHRRGKKTDLPQLAAGELGWSVDDQRLYIGNGTVADGAPAVGNTEVMTAGSTSITTSLSHIYKGYLADLTPIVTGATGDVSRTLQKRLDDYVSVKDFGAVGDDSTADVVAIQRALDELYSDTDQDDTRARRTLFFPAGTYKINASLTIPPFAHLVGEGPDKTIIKNSASAPALVTEDDDGQVYGNIGDSGATTPTQIQISNMTIRTTVAYGGLSIDNATKVFVNNVKFQGTFVAGGTDASTSKGVTVNHSNATYSTSNVTFNQCQFIKFARLVDISYNATNVRFHACHFSTAYYGALIGAEMDGSTAGLNDGPRDMQFTSSSWSTIGQQAILVSPATGATDGAGPRHIVSHANFFAKNVSNNFEGSGTFSEVPIIQFDNDECTSVLDFFERTDLRRADGSSQLNAAPELQGIGIQDKAIKSQTLLSSQTATTINEYPGLSGKGFRIKYKIERDTNVRTGEMVIASSTTSISYDDESVDSGSDVGIILTATVDNKDSTAGNETVTLKYTSTSGSTATFDYQTTIIA